jgi:DNA-binding response OmpR family regulator
MPMHPCPTLRILLVDDDPQMHRLAQLLENPNWQVVTVSDNAAALTKLREWQCSVVLTGITSDFEEDLRFAAEAKQTTPNVKLLLFARHATPEQIVRALKAGVVACFFEGFPVSDVRHFVEGLLETPDWRDGVEVISARPDWISLRVTPRLFTADRVTLYLEELRMDLPETVRHQVGLAFREMLINAMEHGAKFDPELRVEVTAMRTQRAIVYHLRDPGTGFNAKQLPHAAIGREDEDPLAHLAERAAAGLRTGGFGMLMARELVDELVHNEKGNEVLLIKHLDKIAD